MNRIYNEDCLAVLPEIPSASVDAIICDLPFEVTAYEQDRQVPMEFLWEQYNRIIKPKGAIVLFANEKFSYELINANPKHFRYKWYWVKNTGTNFFHASRMPVRHIEEILVFSNKTPTNYYPQKTTGHVPTNSGKGRNTGNCYAGKSQVDYKGGDTTRFPQNVLYFDKVHNYERLHPNQKPVELLEYLIKTYTQEGELVLDNTAGVLSLGVAAENTNRQYICIESDQKYFELGKARLNNFEVVN